MTARIFMTCPEHPYLLDCDDDHAFQVETAATARALLAAMHPGTATSKVAYVVIDCEIAGCNQVIAVRADSITEGRAKASTHNNGWYTARRAGGRIVDGCQWHLGSCCVHHARRLWRDRPDPTLDPDAILPGELAVNGQLDQLDLFAV